MLTFEEAMTETMALARRMWHVLEPLHAVVYYAPQVFDEAATLGYAVHTRWPSYFALRSAPLGGVGHRTVAAAFYSFAPAMVAEHVPATWSVADPGQVLDARLAAVDRAYRALFGEWLDRPEIAEAARSARQAVAALETAGRSLGAANSDLGWPDRPHLQLWHAATILREARGDGHVAALLASGLSPCEALVSFAAVGAASEETFASRGWSEREWAAAREQLVQRGWVDAYGRATDQGREGRRQVERLTDALADAPWQALGPRGAGRLAQLVQPLLQTVIGSGLLPRRSTLGIGQVAA